MTLKGSLLLADVAISIDKVAHPESSTWPRISCLVGTRLVGAIGRKHSGHSTVPERVYLFVRKTLKKLLKNLSGNT